MMRLTSSELPATDGPQLALLRAMRKSLLIWFPDTVRPTAPIEPSALVLGPLPTTALCIALAASVTTPPVALPGMSPTDGAASASPPEIDSAQAAARILVPVAVTVTAAPPASPPYVAPFAEDMSAKFNPAVTVASSTNSFIYSLRCRWNSVSAVNEYAASFPGIDRLKPSAVTALALGRRERV